MGEGEEATYTVWLGTAPTGNVTVTVASNNTDVTFDTDGNTANDESTLTFTTTNWSTAQTVTVTAAQDDDTTSDSATLAHTAAGGGYGSHTASLAVTVTDDDAADAAPVVTVSASAASIEEGAAVTITFTATPAPEEAIDVFYEVEGGRAFGLTGGERDVEIGARETSATVVLQTTPDSAAATDATVTVALVTDVHA